MDSQDMQVLKLSRTLRWTAVVALALVVLVLGYVLKVEHSL